MEQEQVLLRGLALVDGRVGLVMRPTGGLRLVLSFTFADDLITAVDVIADPERLGEVEVAALDGRAPVGI